MTIYNLHSATINVLQLLSYTHMTGETLTAWTEIPERMTSNLQS